MKNRFRIEIYDDVKQNDVTLFSDTKVDKEQLSEIVFGQLRNFQGNVRAFVYDNLKKRKTTALILPMEVVSKYKPKQLTKIELGLI
jgi:S-adenosylmethionine:tRNA-ribosyltransferase-isomerase (queuine synthetase)